MTDQREPAPNEQETQGATPEQEQPQTDPNEAVIAALQAENASLKDAVLRTMAEAQNVQRRIRQQADNERKFAVEPLARELIPVLDNLGRTLQAVESGASVTNLVDGVKAIEKQLAKALESAGLKRVDAVGKRFDPHIHEAIATLETPDHPDETVVNEIEPGYVLHERVIRPARVRVTKRP